MKKLLSILAAASMFAACNAHASGLYAATGVITSIDRAADMMTIQTGNGHLYTMHGVEDFACCDLVSLLMDSNGTDLVTDDMILECTFSGWCVPID